MMRYIEGNPLRAGLVDPEAVAETWRWSSLWRWAHRRRKLQDVPLPADWPVERPRGWTKRVNRPQTEAEEEAMERSIARSRPLGEPEWVKRIAGRLGLQSTLRPRGRPKKERK